MPRSTTGQVRPQGIVWLLLDYSEDRLKIAQQVPAIAQLCLQTSIRRFCSVQPRRWRIGPICCQLRAGWSMWPGVPVRLRSCLIAGARCYCLALCLPVSLRQPASYSISCRSCIASPRVASASLQQRERRARLIKPPRMTGMKECLSPRARFVLQTYGT
jgi:hypothetical protein